MLLLLLLLHAARRFTGHSATVAMGHQCYTAPGTLTLHDWTLADGA